MICNLMQKMRKVLSTNFSQNLKKDLNEILFALSNKKTKRNELLIKYMKNLKLFVIKSHHVVYTKFEISDLYYRINSQKTINNILKAIQCL